MTELHAKIQPEHDPSQSRNPLPPIARLHDSPMPSRPAPNDDHSEWPIRESGIGAWQSDSAMDKPVNENRRTGPADAIPGPVCVLKTCVPRTIQWLDDPADHRNVPHMAYRRSLNGSYDDARRLVAATKRHRPVGDFVVSMMIRLAM